MYHGNADVERGLLVNNSIVTKERNQLNVAVINGLKAKDAVKFYDLELMRPEKAPYDWACLVISKKCPFWLSEERWTSERERRKVKKRV